jgi:hypothetical protein
MFRAGTRRRAIAKTSAGTAGCTWLVRRWRIGNWFKKYPFSVRT